MAARAAPSYPALSCACPVLGVLDKCDLVGGHMVKQAARESDGWFKFWLCILLASLKWAASPWEPQAFTHLLPGGVGGWEKLMLGNHSACLGTSEVLGRYHGMKKVPERLWH